MTLLLAYESPNLVNLDALARKAAHGLIHQSGAGIAKVVSMADGEAVESTVAELNPLLDDGYAHYFRAECVPGDFRGSPADLIESMAETARMNGLQDPEIWAEELPDGLAVGRLRAKIDSGLRVYTLDIRRYPGEASMLDVWAGAERFPTEGIVMFFKSVAYRGRFLYEK